MIPLFKIHSPAGVGTKIQEVFDAGVITEGEFSDRFENEFGSYVGNSNCSLVNSCTSALTLAYRLSDLGPDTEIITTPMTCMATNEPAHLTGAKLVFADIDPTTGNIDPESIKKRLSKRTKAVVAVHWAGQPFDINAVRHVVKQYNPNIKIIEDAAHALGASYENKPIGGHSDYVCFSFQAIKHLTTVDGGAICSLSTNDDARIKKIRWFGLDRKYVGQRWEQDITESGYKFHMNNVNAIIGLEQMKHIDFIVNSHKKNGKLYDARINNPKIESSYWIYSLLVDNKEKFKQHLTMNGIASDVVHMRNDHYSVFGDFKQQDLSGTDAFCNKMINIPVGWWLSDADLDKIVDVINNY